MNAQPPSKPNITLSTKVGIDEAVALDQKAALAGLTRSAFLRQAAISGKVMPRLVIPEINRVQWGELGRLSGNLNQIAIRMNQGSPVDESLSAAIDELRELLSDVRATLIGLEVSHGRKD